MKRRDFITLLGGAAAVAWPLASLAQQPAMPVVGYLDSGSPEGRASLVAAFRKGLSETGFVEGRNVAIEYRWAHDDFARLPELAADLVRRQVAVIAAVNSLPAPLAAKAATATIPIVFGMGGDPVQSGLVVSLNRPGGNITGLTSMSSELGAKRLGLLHALLPGAARFAVLVDPPRPRAEVVIKDAASTIGRQIEFLYASTSGEIDAAFASLVQKRADALLTTPSAVFGVQRVQLTTLAARYAVPVMYHDRIYTEAGGLMSYGSSFADEYRQIGVYVGRILKGEKKPADLPVLQPTRFEFIINLKTARALGLDIPPNLLAISDEVIE
jgi:putative tryptophan/tyrosine transport system substrate-binding protein